MLEQGPACLKQVGRQIPKTTRLRPRSRRSLHLAFWCHGAGDIALPSWWIELLQRPPPAKSSSTQSIAQTAKDCLVAGLANGTFLDFLYPAKTLTLIHKLAVRDLAHHQRRSSAQFAQSTPRTYAAESENTHVAVESDRDYADQLVQDLQRMGTPYDLENDKLLRTRRTPKHSGGSEVADYSSHTSEPVRKVEPDVSLDDASVRIGEVRDRKTERRKTSGLHAQVDHQKPFDTLVITGSEDVREDAHDSGGNCVSLASSAPRTNIEEDSAPSAISVVAESEFEIEDEVLRKTDNARFHASMEQSQRRYPLTHLSKTQRRKAPVLQQARATTGPHTKAITRETYKLKRPPRDTAFKKDTSFKNSISQWSANFHFKGVEPSLLETYIADLKTFEKETRALVKPGEVFPSDAKVSIEKRGKLLQKQAREIAESYAHQTLNRFAKNGPCNRKDFDVALKAAFFVNAYSIGRQYIRTATEAGKPHTAVASLHNLSHIFGNWDFTATMWSEWAALHEPSSFWKPIRRCEVPSLVRDASTCTLWPSKQDPDKSVKQKAVLRRYLRRFMKHLLANGARYQIKPQIFDGIWSLLGQLQARGKVFYRLALQHLLTWKPNSEQSSGQVRRAYDLWKQIRTDKHFRVDEAILEKLMLSMCEVGHRDSFQVFNDWTERFGTPSLAMFDSHVRALSSIGEVDEVWKLLKRYHTVYDGSNLSEYLAWLIEAYGNRGEYWQAVKLFRSLETAHRLRRTIGHWNGLLQVFAKLGDTEEIEKLCLEMKESGVKFNVSTFVIKLRAYAGKGDLENLYEVIKELKATDLPLNADVVECLVEGYVRNQALEEAENIVMGAQDMGVTGSHTRYWNALLRGCATLGQFEKVQELFREMVSARVKVDENTCASLMTAFCARRLPFVATSVMKKLMPPLGLQVSAPHFNIMMSGFIAIKDYTSAIDAFQEMEAQDIEPDQESKILAIRAAARLDKAKYQETVRHEDDSLQLSRAEALLDKFLAKADPKDLITRYSVFGDSSETRQHERFVANYFDELIHIYAEYEVHDKVAELYQRYTSLLLAYRPDSADDDTPPLSILAALMNNFRAQKQWDQVERCWAQAYGKASAIVRRNGADLSQPGWVLPSRRHYLSRPLYQQMRALATQQRGTDLDRLVDGLYADGFALDSHAMNLYVQNLALGRRRDSPDDANAPLRAFSLAETEFMDNWRGWPRNEFYKVQENRQPLPAELDRKAPEYLTLVTLAAAYVRIRREGALDGAQNDRLREVMVIAPRVVTAITRMPKMHDEYQEALLRPGSQST